jgi:hypothetical protein
MVVQQIDLVDVQDAAVRVCQKAWFEGFHALGQSALDVERADEPVLRRTHRQFHHPRRPRCAGPRLVRPVRARRIG